MRILSFRIENFRNLAQAECTEVPDFVVVCGGNGSGKSALLEALMTAKEHAGSYGHFTFDARAVSADAESATISLKVAFSEAEREFVTKTYNETCPAEDEAVISISKGGAGKALKTSKAIRRLFGYYSRADGSPGFFDYITAHRQTQKLDLQNWDATFLSEEHAKNTLGGQQKFQNTKRYLAGLKMRDLQALQDVVERGLSPTEANVPNSLRSIRSFFDRFFSPMSFGDVYLNRSPFGFTVNTPRGQIDIDDLSSGEKEILNIFVRFDQIQPHDAVILFDEADAHLHPDLERRYLAELRGYTPRNQLLITTHSPEMMIAAGTDALYAVLKEPPPGGGNQFVRVTGTDQLHEALTDLMGSRGLVSFNQRIVFIEGDDTSADRAIYERCYPPAEYNVSFVPAGNSATVRRTAAQVNALLSSSIGFQQYYSVVDGDIDRALPPPVGPERLFKLPVYHVENLLLEDSLVWTTVKAMLGPKCPIASLDEMTARLQAAVMSDGHIKPFTRALLDSKIAALAQAAYEAVYKGGEGSSSVPTFADVELEARATMSAALIDGTWRSKCKGRDVLKALCADVGLGYEHFRNLLIDRLDQPPAPLAEIMAKVLGPTK
jgi:predicted ATPase